MRNGWSVSTRMGALLAALALMLATGAIPASRAPRPAFRAYELYVDAGGVPLAAWQVEVLDVGDRRSIVGVEGGDHAAYAAPPFYDPAALRGGRIILAAFSTADDLPTRETRVARVHMRIPDENGAVPEVRLEAAATRGGVEIPVTIRLEEVR